MRVLVKIVLIDHGDVTAIPLVLAKQRGISTHYAEGCDEPYRNVPHGLLAHDAFMCYDCKTDTSKAETLAMGVPELAELYDFMIHHPRACRQIDRLQARHL